MRKFLLLGGVVCLSCAPVQYGLCDDFGVYPSEIRTNYQRSSSDVKLGSGPARYDKKHYGGVSGLAGEVDENSGGVEVVWTIGKDACSQR